MGNVVCNSSFDRFFCNWYLATGRTLCWNKTLPLRLGSDSLRQCCCLCFRANTGACTALHGNHAGNWPDFKKKKSHPSIKGLFFFSVGSSRDSCAGSINGCRNTCASVVVAESRGREQVPGRKGWQLLGVTQLMLTCPLPGSRVGVCTCTTAALIQVCAQSSRFKRPPKAQDKGEFNLFLRS